MAVKVLGLRMVSHIAFITSAQHTEHTGPQAPISQSTGAHNCQMYGMDLE